MQANTRAKQFFTRTLLTIGIAVLTVAVGRGDTFGRQFPLYVMDESRSVFKVDSSGNVTPFALIQDLGPIAVAPNNEVFGLRMLDNYTLYKLDAMGNVNLLPNNSNAHLYAIAFDNFGNLYAATSDKVVRLDPAGNAIPYATGESDSSWAMAFAPDGNLYRAEGFSTTIHRTDNNGKLVSFITLTKIGAVAALTFDKAGNMYAASHVENTIVKVDRAGNESVVASGGLIAYPTSLAIDDNGNVYVASNLSGSIVKVTPDGTQHPFAWTGRPFWIGLSYPSNASAFIFGGFVEPVNNAPFVNTGNAGKSYPVKWSLKNMAGQNVSDLGAVKSITYKAVGCDAFAGGPTDELVDAVVAGGSGLRYDAGANRYIYNWASPPIPGCYSLILTLSSMQSFEAHFRLK